MAFTIITGGSFTSTGVAVQIPLPSSADYVKTWNITQLSATNPNKVAMCEWFGANFGAGQSAVGGGIAYTNNGSGVLAPSALSNPAGFTYVTTTLPQVSAVTTSVTNITDANPAVVSQTNTYPNGTVVIFYGTTGMLQIAGIPFQISSASGSGYTLLGLDSSGFASVASAGSTRAISNYYAAEPQFLYVTKITQAANCIVWTSVDPSLYYVVGMKVKLTVPYSFGMVQADQLTGTILALNTASNAYSMTLNINTTAFTAFSFPLTGNVPGVMSQGFPTVAPAGASTTFNPVTNVYTGYNFGLQPFHTGQDVPYILLGTTSGGAGPAGSNADVINWMAYQME